MWLVDGNNVMGTRPDGWWRDRHGAMQRLVNQLDDFATQGDEEVAVIFDGRERDLQAVRVRVGFAPHADDALTERADRTTTVVTSDRELVARVERKGARVEGARTFLDRM